ncbi:hypothetical protein CONPUDRAFT_149340 [Coniophora puteana RWD-64-598 SS2]|uniref:Swi5-domain-containing protein n=1 Tax=Coniophora puteana (strain RWD-64-598) TaxID=741705 RepID=A0A5M3N792_CONPW|nr:uncharacterized protein CONPUDRAFT_149340 [Coniophora puteana RWD-64-598 SS2]EIW87312.1 hypothetical protein CONPUDRAFT_149340 [Coniophora puteana RWD-64-598 SS2]
MYASFSEEAQKNRLEQLQAEVNELQKTLGENKNAERIVANHIQLLHRYNEAKDAAQILIGRLANLKGTTVRQIHEDMDLLDDDKT